MRKEGMGVLSGIKTGKRKHYESFKKKGGGCVWRRKCYIFSSCQTIGQH